MAKPTIRIHDTSKDETIDREMTNAEFTVYEADQARLATQATELAEAEAAKAAAQAKLAALGLSTEDLKALGL